MSYNGVKHLKTASGNAPEASMLDHGAIAIAYKEGEESIFIKNTNDEIVKISSTKVFKDIDTLYARISEVTGGASDALQSFKEVNDWIKEHEEDYKELTALTNTYATQTSVNAAQTAADNAQESADSLSVLVNDSAKGNTALYDAIQGLSVGTESNAYSCLLIELIANNAQTSANSAQTTADNAQTAANNAQTAADNANLKANNAYNLAGNASNAASAAQTTANSAYSLADDAYSSANAAKASATNINNKLNDTTSGLTALYNSIISLETYKNELFDEINAIKIQLGGGSY